MICRGLGALIAEKFAFEGCNVAVNYIANLERANETAEKIERIYKAKTAVIQGVCIDRQIQYIDLILVGDAEHNSRMWESRQTATELSTRVQRLWAGWISSYRML